VITACAWSGKRYAVLGLGRSGRSTVESLLASGAEVVAWDESEAARNAILPGTGGGTSAVGGGGARRAQGSPEGPLHPSAAPSGPPPRPGEDLSFADPLTLDLTGFEAVVVAPGIPINRHPITAHAAKHSVPLIGDIELFAQARPELPPHKVVGITGTNGKSTTTALVHHILKTAGVPTTMGGNIGLPILAQDPLAEGGVYVLELSSYQIDLTYSLDCDVAVLLNITPDHLDRYDGASRLIQLREPRLFRDATKARTPMRGADTASFRRWPTIMRVQFRSTWTSWRLQTCFGASERVACPPGPHNKKIAAVLA
jgi:UDP-N-acetylmuramoylalanine--D-glutamate ligase